MVVLLTAAMMVVEIAAGAGLRLNRPARVRAAHGLARGHPRRRRLRLYLRAPPGGRPPCFAFGTGKINALGGYTGAVLLAAFALAMAWEGVARLLAPASIAFDLAIRVAAVGLAVNAASVLILGGHGNDHRHRDDRHHRDGAIMATATAMTTDPVPASDTT